MSLQKLNRKTRVVVNLIIGLAVLTVGTLILSGVYSHRNNVSSYHDELQRNLASLQDVEEQVEALYADSQEDFLAEDLALGDVANVAKKAGKYSVKSKKSYLNTTNQTLYEKLQTLQKKVNQQLTDLQNKATVQTQLNTLYDQTVLNGTQVVTTLGIKETTTQTDLTATTTNFQTLFPQVTGDWHKAVSTLLKAGTEQLQSFTASEALLAQYQKTPTTEKEQAAQTAINQLRDGSRKTELLKQLATLQEKAVVAHNNATPPTDKETAATPTKEQDDTAGNDRRTASSGTTQKQETTNTQEKEKTPPASDKEETTPATTEAPEKETGNNPYPLKAYNGSGTPFDNYADAVAAGEEAIAASNPPESTTEETTTTSEETTTSSEDTDTDTDDSTQPTPSGPTSYKIFEQPWSDGSFIYYLELY